MSELASIGKWLSICISALLYLFAWCWALDHQKDCNMNAIWEVLISRLFIGVHIIAMVGWFIWSWKH